MNEQILNYGINSLQDRFNYHEPLENDVVFLEAPDGMICRIIYNAGKVIISVQNKLLDRLKVYLETIDLKTSLRNPLFYKELLKLFEVDPDSYTLEPTDELIENKHYNCIHSLEFVCSKEYFLPFMSVNKITEVHRGDDGFYLEDNFGDVIYCVYEDGKQVAGSYYRPNQGKYKNTYAMQVFTRKGFRGKGYATSTASSATADVCEKNGIALWVCQVENQASINIAQRLGYIFMGAEIRIIE